jgi:hypothetical protein
MMRAVLTLVFAAAVLAGCSSNMVDSFTFMQSPEKPLRRDLFPADFKNDILRTVPSVVADRTGIREASYSEPVRDTSANTYASCVRFNARDGNGQYVGVKEYAAYYYNGDLNQLVAADAGQCKSASYKPFPELERLCPTVGKCG